MLVLQGGCFYCASLCLAQLVRQIINYGEQLAPLATLRHDFKLNLLAELFGLFDSLMV